MAITARGQGRGPLFAGGIGWAGVVLKLDPDKPAVTEVWRGRQEQPNGRLPGQLDADIEDGVIYGVDQPGCLRAVELDTGKRLWDDAAGASGKDEDPEADGPTGPGRRSW